MSRRTEALDEARIVMALPDVVDHFENDISHVFDGEFQVAQLDQLILEIEGQLSKSLEFLGIVDVLLEIAEAECSIEAIAIAACTSNVFVLLHQLLGVRRRQERLSNYQS